MIQLTHVSKEFGNKQILDNASLAIYEGERVGVIGDNGQGKSTLLEIIAGRQNVDSGVVSVGEDVGFLEQNALLNLAELLESLKDPDFANAFYKNLKILGLNDNIALTHERVEHLSCGERTKIKLSMVLANTPSLLLLDEPTNHLDMRGKRQLLELLNGFYGTIIAVSHDVEFLNAFAYKIIEVKGGMLTEYMGNFADYTAQKENEKLRIAREYEAHQKRVKDINKQIDNYREAAHMSDLKKTAMRKTRRRNDTCTQDERSRSLSRFAASRITKLRQELEKDIEHPEREHVIRYKLKKEDLHTRFAYIVEDLGKTYDDKAQFKSADTQPATNHAQNSKRVLFKHANFTIESGDKIALIGDNGVGKSTLINIMLGNTDYTGKLFTAPSVRPVLMRQDVYDLDFNSTINEMSQSFDKNYRTNFILNLTTMNIDKTRFDIPIGKLSSGEKMRIKLTEIILSDANLIILDEPTNHLDIANKQYLEKVLAGYQGTLIVISHDVDFLRNTTNKTLEIVDHHIHVHAGAPKK